MEIETGVMILRNMLDDRQPQPGAAGGLGTALVHPEKPFKHPCLILRGIPIPVSFTVTVVPASLGIFFEDDNMEHMAFQ